MRPVPLVAASCAGSSCVDMSTCSLFPSIAKRECAPRDTGAAIRDRHELCIRGLSSKNGFWARAGSTMVWGARTRKDALSRPRDRL
eukprot:4952294-Pleurochrysis_carterae.AAC.1